MKLPRFRIQTRAGQLAWLQVLSLAISGLFYYLGDLLPALVMLVLATLFGVTATMRRARDAQRTHPELFQKRQRRR
jgi:hypothetical protein